MKVHKLYQDFKWSVVAGWPQDKDWKLESRDIDVFLGPEFIDRKGAKSR